MRSVVFVLGGPGVGKGTQCSLLSNKFFPTIQHFSAGELLRQASSTNYAEGELIRNVLSEGGIIPGHITIGLLRKAITGSSAKIILIDGFPRAIDQGLQFERDVVPCKFTLYLEAPQRLLNARLIEREKSQRAQGKIRSDDNEICRAKEQRFKVHEECCLPVVKYYKDQGKLLTVPAVGSAQSIHSSMSYIFEELLKDEPNRVIITYKEVIDPTANKAFESVKIKKYERMLSFFQRMEKEAWVVTGASGFVGGRLVSLLAEELLAGDETNVIIYCLIRRSSDTTELASICKQGIIKGIVEVIRLDDLCNTQSIIDVVPIDSVTYIYHSAAKGGDWGPEAEFVHANLEMTKSMVAFASQCHNLRRFLHVSTVDVYPHLLPKDCHENVEPIKKSKYHYSHTKANAERAVTGSEIPWTIIRPAVVYGPHSYTWGLQEAILISQGKGVLIDGANYRSGAIYVDDLVEAIILSSRSPVALRRKYNACDPTSGTWKEFYDGIADALNKPRIRFSIPYWLAWILTFVMEFIWRLFGFEDRPLLTFFLLRLIGNDQDWPIFRAQEDFGWVPRTPLKDGMEKMMEWLDRTKLHLDTAFLH